MAIRVNPGVAHLGGMVFDAARKREERRQMESDRAFDLQERQLEQRRSLALANIGSAERRQAAQFEYQMRAQDRAAVLREQAANNEAERWMDRREYDAEINKMLRDYDFTQTAKRERQKLAETLDYIDQQPWPEETKESLRQEAHEQYLGFRPNVKREPPPPPTTISLPGGRQMTLEPGQIKNVPGYGMFYLDPDGRLQQFDPQKKEGGLSAKDKADIYRDMIGQYTTNDENGNPVTDWEALQKAFEALIAQIDVPEPTPEEEAVIAADEEAMIAEEEAAIQEEEAAIAEESAAAIDQVVHDRDTDWGRLAQYDPGRYGYAELEHLSDDQLADLNATLNHWQKSYVNPEDKQRAMNQMLVVGKEIAIRANRNAAPAPGDMAATAAMEEAVAAGVAEPDIATQLEQRGIPAPPDWVLESDQFATFDVEGYPNINMVGLGVRQGTGEVVFPEGASHMVLKSAKVGEVMLDKQAIQSAMKAAGFQTEAQALNDILIALVEQQLELASKGKP